MNKIFRENLDFLFERFEAHDLCSIVVCCLTLCSLTSNHELNISNDFSITTIASLSLFTCWDIVELQDLQRLVEILRLTHELLSEHVMMDPFPLMMGEMTETISLVSFSGRIATQVSSFSVCCTYWLLFQCQLGAGKFRIVCLFDEILSLCCILNFSDLQK